MSIFLAVIVTILLLIISVLYLIIGGISAPQYGNEKYRKRYNIIFYSVLLTTSVILPIITWWIALK